MAAHERPDLANLLLIHEEHTLGGYNGFGRSGRTRRKQQLRYGVGSEGVEGLLYSFVILRLEDLGPGGNINCPRLLAVGGDFRIV